MEIWRNIKNYEGLYQVSNLGRVRSLKYNKVKLLKTNINSDGYYNVKLYKDGVTKSFRVHRLVWETFNGDIPEGMQVNHINEIKTDNKIENLNLLTPRENHTWGTCVKRIKTKTTNGKCSKSVLQFDLNDNLLKEYPSIHQAERETGFSNSYISACCKGKYKTAYGFKWQYK